MSFTVETAQTVERKTINSYTQMYGIVSQEEESAFDYLEAKLKEILINSVTLLCADIYVPTFCTL